MSLSDDPIIPTEPPQPPREDPSAVQRGRRRRVTRREMIPTDAAGQAELIGALSKRAFPSIELFIFSLASGAILGLGFMLDSQPLILLGILLAPLMTPWVGFLLAIFTGSMRLLFETSMALLISILLVFISGLIIGFTTRAFPPMVHDNLYIYAYLWKSTLFVLAIGAVTLVASFIRSENKPFLPSVIIAYAFFLPVSAAGFGLGSGLPGVWPLGIFTSIVHLALASVLGLITLFALRIRPTSGGYALSGLGLAIFIAILVAYMKPANQPAPQTTIATSTLQTGGAPASLTPSLALVLTNTITPSLTSTTLTTATESTTLSVTPLVLTETPTLTPTNTATPLSVTPVPLTLAITLPPSTTPTVTLTLEVQSISGAVSADEGGGANLRQTPNGKYLMTLDNGTIVDIYPDFKIVNGVTWIRVLVTRNGQRVEGWLLESVVTYSTPAPNFNASSTPTIGITPAP
jgi:hypothetical protein